MKKFQYKKTGEEGIVILEILIATVVFALAVTGAIMVSFGGQTGALDVGLTTGGLNRVVSGMETSVASAASAWDTFTNENVNDAPYTLIRTVTDISPCAKFVENTNAWDSEHNRTLGASLENIVVNTEIARMLGGGCSAVPPGKWDTPTSLGEVSSSDVDGTPTGLGLAFINGGRYAFLTTKSNSASPKDDVWVFDTTGIDAENHNNPVSVAPENPGDTDISDSLNDATVARNPVDGRWYAYVVGYVKDQAGSCPPPAPASRKPYIKQLQILDVSNPVFPLLTASTNLTDIDSCGSYPAGYSVYYFDEKVYVGTKETAGAELAIFDVSDPANPELKGSIDVNRNVNAIVVREGLAYLATGPGASGVNNPLRIYDVDPDSPTFGQLRGSFTAAQTDNQAGTAIYLLNDRLYLGLEHATDSGNKDFYVLDVSSATSPEEFGSGSSVNLGLVGSGSFVATMTVQGPYAFLGPASTNPEDSGIQIWDISGVSDTSGSEDLKRVNTCTAGDPLSKDAVGFIYADNLVFGALDSTRPLRILYDDPDLSCS